MEYRHAGRAVGRRRFLQIVSAGLAGWLAAVRRTALAEARYRVGVGRSADAYEATLRAIRACGEWPAAAISDRTVVIKPNLVIEKTAESGATTDPQVVRALVDLSLQAGAKRVLIAESSSNFKPCGYEFFRSYDSLARVSLIDLSSQPVELRYVPDGLAYRMIYMPKLVLQPDVFYISAAKLKCHVDSLVSLAMKNSFGLPPIAPYQDSWIKGRFAMHKRGVHQTVVDLSLVRPIDFAVVDGIWGMEGSGPLSGVPVYVGLVVAGCNAVAVDRTCLEIMSIPQSDVQHLEYATRLGLGPADLRDVALRGDSFIARGFKQPPTPPVVEYPQSAPGKFVPAVGQHTRISYTVTAPCWTKVEVVRAPDIWPTVEQIRTLHDWALRPAGVEVLEWDGRDNFGQTVSPGLYTVRVHAAYRRNGRDSYATGPVLVDAPGVRIRKRIPAFQVLPIG